nr:hypothetical protein [Tanacetum cinerariifolium]
MTLRLVAPEYAYCCTWRTPCQGRAASILNDREQPEGGSRVLVLGHHDYPMWQRFSPRLAGVAGPAPR